MARSRSRSRRKSTSFRRSHSNSRKSKTRNNDWQIFLTEMKGRGYSRKELSKMYREKYKINEHNIENKRQIPLHSFPIHQNSRGQIEVPKVGISPKKFKLDPRLKSLTHTTKNIWNVGEILQSGYLKPRDTLPREDQYDQFGGSGKYVYLDSVCDGPFDYFKMSFWHSATLHISPKILEDRDDYYLGVDWPYGNIERGEYYRKKDFDVWINKIYYFMEDKNTKQKIEGGTCVHNEVLFENPISLDKYLTKISLSVEGIKRYEKIYKKKFIVENFVPEKYLNLVVLESGNELWKDYYKKYPDGSVDYYQK